MIGGDLLHGEDVQKEKINLNPNPIIAKGMYWSDL